MKKHILLTGATGMLGKNLITSLLNKGYQVSILSRKAQKINGIKVFIWDVNAQTIDRSCLDGVDSIIHLAGENVSKEKWTEKRKKEITASRVQSAGLLFKTLQENQNQVTTFISAAAVGYYGDRTDEVLTEESPAGTDFLAECCVKWEKSADQFEALGIRVVKIRTGVVLAKNDGALPAMATPIKFFAGAPLGNGKQWVPWIHHDDMTQIYIHTLENSGISGTYNACAPFPVTNKTITKAIAKELNRPVWPFNVPEQVMKLILGEMSVIVLNSINTSAEKLVNTGFVFKHATLEAALTDIYGS